MNIGIDIDGVITDFVDTFKKVVKKKYNIELAENQIREHDLYKILGIRQDESMELILETLKHDLKPQNGAKKIINELYKKHKIIILTARPPETLDITKNWFKKHGIKYHKLGYSKEGNKSEYQGKLDVIIDDHLKEVINWVGKVSLVMVFDHPWNRSLNVEKNFIRVKNWLDIMKTINR